MDLIENLLSDTAATAAIIATFVSLICSFATALLTTKRELKKMEFAANREDRTAEAKAFQEMSKAVSKCVYLPLTDYREETLSAIAVVRTFKGGYLGDLLDELCAAVSADDLAKAKEILFDIYANWVDPEKQ